MADPLLVVQGLQYRYADGTEALCGLDLTVADGEKVALVGANGSGKSTLLMCLAGLFGGQGTVHVDGEVIAPKRIRQTRRQVGLVFQSPDDQLFMPTLADDLAFGPINLGWSADRVRECVDRAATRMGVETFLDRPPHHLSMGQKRNAAIATVLATQPSLLLMDEPSSSLDPRSRRRLIEVLSELDATLLIASHDLEMVGQLCKRVVLIAGGRVVADGPTNEILGDAALTEAHGLDIWRDVRH